MAQTETGQSQRKLIIKLHLPRSQKRAPSEASSDTCCNKRVTVVGSEVVSAKPRSSTETQYCYNTDEYSKIQTRDKENTTKDSSIMYQQDCEIKEGSCSKNKMRKVATDEVNTEYPTKSSFVVGKSSRISRTGSEEYCKLKIKEGVECREKEKKKPRMEHYKKMQCWVILKRLMTGRDAWAFKHSLFLKDLEILDNNSNINESMSKPTTILGMKKKIKSELESSETIMKPIGLEEIESKLNKWLYLEPDEFAHDIRLVFSYALLHPPRNEIHKIARRLSEDFELKWKSLKDKWTNEEGKRGNKKISKRKVHEKRTQKGLDLRLRSSFVC